MGTDCCCPKDEEPIVVQSNNQGQKGRGKQEKPVNVFKPGARDVRIVENEETGKLEKVKYKPPSDPNKVNEDQ
jgi:hypothetical protein